MIWGGHMTVKFGILSEKELPIFKIKIHQSLLLAFIHKWVCNQCHSETLILKINIRAV